VNRGDYVVSVTKKVMYMNTSVDKKGDKYKIHNPLMSVETDVELAVGSIGEDIREILAILSIIYMKAGRQTAKKITEVIGNAKI